MTVGELLRDAATGLAASTSPRLDAELLLAHVLGTDRATLYRRSRDRVEATAAQALQHLLARRRAGEPVPYLTNRCEFFGLELFVDARVLVPRPETELLVEAVLERAPSAGRVAELGTGSGAVALAIARERPDLTVIATDASTAALAVARCNGGRLNLPNIQFVHGHWLDPLADDRFDVICSNPPYIAAADAALSDRALRCEPAMALVSGSDGLDAIRAITCGARERLRPGGSVALEHGSAQGPEVRRLLSSGGLSAVWTNRDLAGHERISGGVRSG